MRLPSPDKRARILDAGAELFASQPFHKVLLDHVAQAAGVGKGTVYLYFSSKDELYLAVLFRGFAGLVGEMREELAHGDSPPPARVEGIVRSIVRHLHGNPVLRELMRGAVVGFPDNGEWAATRREFYGLIAEVIRRGVASGAFTDSHPELTATYVPGLIRSAVMFLPPDVDQETLAGHAAAFVLRALQPAG